MDYDSDAVDDEDLPGWRYRCVVRTDHDFKTEIMFKFMSNGHELMTQHPVEVATRFTCIQTVIIPWILTFWDIDIFESHSSCTTVFMCWSKMTKWTSLDYKTHGVFLYRGNRPISIISKYFSNISTVFTHKSKMSRWVSKHFWMVLEGYSKSRKTLHIGPNWGVEVTFDVELSVI